MLKKMGVNTEGLSPHITNLFGLLDRVFIKYGNRECIITSGNDSQHMVGSLHYRGLAVDLRIRDLPPAKVRAVFEVLKQELEHKGYDVLLETNHIHVEYDPK